MKEFRLLGIILFVLKHLDIVECACTLPFGSGTYISNSRGTWTTTNTTIKNYKVTIGSLTTTVTFTCSELYDNNRYILITYYELLKNNYINIYTCLDIRNSSYADKYYFYEATALDSSIGDYLSGDSTDVCNRVNYETAVETKVVIKQGTSDINKIYCPNIILGNYTYNTTEDYSDMASCNDTQQLTFKKNKAVYVALSSGGNLKCMYSGTGTYVYLITFNNDSTVDGSNTYQFTCFVFSFSGYGSLVYASQRPQSCSSSQTPTNADSTSGKTFIFTPYAICPIADSSTDNRASEDLGWLGGLIAVIILLIMTGITIVYLYFKKNKVYYKETEECGSESLRDISIYQQEFNLTYQNPPDLVGGQSIETNIHGERRGREDERAMVAKQKKLNRKHRHRKNLQIRDDSGKTEVSWIFNSKSMKCSLQKQHVYFVTSQRLIVSRRICAFISTTRLQSNENLAIALKRLRERLGRPKRLRPVKEHTRLKRSETASSNINIQNVVKKGEENGMYPNHPKPEELGPPGSDSKARELRAGNIR